MVRGRGKSRRCFLPRRCFSGTLKHDHSISGSTSQEPDPSPGKAYHQQIRFLTAQSVYPGLNVPASQRQHEPRPGHPTSAEEIPTEPGPEPEPQAVDLSLFGSPRSADVVVILKSGKEILAHMSILQSCSDYFASQSSFESLVSDGLAGKINNSSRRHTVNTSFITTDDDVMARILLFMYTRRREDLALTETNAVRYLGPAHRLVMKPHVDLMSFVLSQLQVFPDYIEHMVKELATVPEELMLEMFGKSVDVAEGHAYVESASSTACRTCHPDGCNYGYHGRYNHPLHQTCASCGKCTTHCPQFDIFVPVSLPIMWLMSTPDHHRDVLCLRDSVQKIFGERLQHRLGPSIGTVATIEAKHREAVKTSSVQATSNVKFMAAYHVLFSAPTL
ncbi:hypothetical protein HKX48_005188 [Thoreauomyces humboldtii]|nr:hypothetical protein HKX48_005188 [Thoreauomyces humboldtii]